MELKELFKYKDFYKNKTIFDELKKRYRLVSWRSNSIPSEGSRTWRIEEIKTIKEDVLIHKSIFHKDGSVTLVTSKGYTKFLN